MNRLGKLFLRTVRATLQFTGTGGIKNSMNNTNYKIIQKRNTHK